jgi:hypothetical protein
MRRDVDHRRWPATSVPPPRLNTVRYAGVLAPRLDGPGLRPPVVRIGSEVLYFLAQALGSLAHRLGFLTPSLDALTHELDLDSHGLTMSAHDLDFIGEEFSPRRRHVRSSTAAWSTPVEVLVPLAEVIDFVAKDLGVDTAVMGRVAT